jgi:hypothetical protein
MMNQESIKALLIQETKGYHNKLEGRIDNISQDYQGIHQHSGMLIDITLFLINLPQSIIQTPSTPKEASLLHTETPRQDIQL